MVAEVRVVSAELKDCPLLRKHARLSRLTRTQYRVPVIRKLRCCIGYWSYFCVRGACQQIRLSSTSLSTRGIVSVSPTTRMQP